VSAKGAKGPTPGGGAKRKKGRGRDGHHGCDVEQAPGRLTAVEHPQALTALIRLWHDC
jgi:hypothetical protein